MDRIEGGGDEFQKKCPLLKFSDWNVILRERDLNMRDFRIDSDFVTFLNRKLGHFCHFLRIGIKIDSDFDKL